MAANLQCFIVTKKMFQTGRKWMSSRIYGAIIIKTDCMNKILNTASLSHSFLTSS
jgi:hypothetical protein